MYNKLFEKILDSSIWLEDDTTRIVWITLIAAMDEDGFCQFASVANLAHRAVVSKEAAERAVKILESPDANSSDPDHDGRRIERVYGGWMVLNSKKYHDIAKREQMKEQTRQRVARFRSRNADVTQGNDSVTISDSDSDSDSDSEENTESQDQNPSPSQNEGGVDSLFADAVKVKPKPPEKGKDKIVPVSSLAAVDEIYQAYPRKVGRGAAIKEIEKAFTRLIAGEGPYKFIPAEANKFLLMAAECYAKSSAGNRGKFTPHPRTWFHQSRYLDNPKEWERENEQSAGTNGKGDHNMGVRERFLIRAERRRIADEDGDAQGSENRPADAGVVLLGSE